MVRAGDLNGIMLCFDAQLADGVRLTNSPHSATAASSWNATTWPVWPAARVDAADILRVSVKGGARGGFRIGAEVVPAS